MNKEEYRTLGGKILQGCQLAFEKLLAQEKLIDGELVFAEKDGSVVRVKARDYEAYKEKKDNEKQA
jgi:hypothetical protein